MDEVMCDHKKKMGTSPFSELQERIGWFRSIQTLNSRVQRSNFPDDPSWLQLHVEVEIVASYTTR